MAHTIKRAHTRPRLPAALPTLSLFAVRLEVVREAWQHDPVARAAAAFPRGRLAAMAGPPAAAPLAHLDQIDRDQPATRLVLALGAAGAQKVWDALLEDRAEAALYDAPSLTLAEVLAAAARVASRAELEVAHLDRSAEPAYPPELLEPGRTPASVVWLGATEASQARTALAAVLTLPVGAFPTKEPALFRDLAESLLAVLDAAARPRHSLVAMRP